MEVDMKTFEDDEPPQENRVDKEYSIVWFINTMVHLELVRHRLISRAKAYVRVEHHYKINTLHDKKAAKEAKKECQ